MNYECSIWRRMSKFYAYSKAYDEIELLKLRSKVIPMPIGCNLLRLKDRCA